MFKECLNNNIVPFIISDQYKNYYYRGLKEGQTGGKKGYLRDPCGNKYAMDRTPSISFKLKNVRHRHCVFTIDEHLREFFLNDRSLLDCLFHAVNNVVSRMFFKQNKSMNFTPGFIMVLHTFGRDLKWNPKPILLCKKVKSRCYREHKDGFYVYAKPDKCDPKTAIKYIGRCLGRPVTVASRIDKYDGDFVTFHYNRHEDDAYIEETLPVMEFIGRLIRHIPEKHYKIDAV